MLSRAGLELLYLPPSPRDVTCDVRGGDRTPPGRPRSRGECLNCKINVSVRRVQLASAENKSVNNVHTKGNYDAFMV